MIRQAIAFLLTHIDALIPILIGTIFWLQGAGVIPFERNQEKDPFLTAIKGDKRSQLKNIGIGLVVIGMVFGFVGFFRKSEPHDLKMAAASLAATLNSNVPKQVDEFTILEEVAASGETVTMKFSLPMNTFAEAAPMAEVLRSDVSQASCGSSMRKFFAAGGTIEYSYYSSDSQLVVRFSLDEPTCAALR